MKIRFKGLPTKKEHFTQSAKSFSCKRCLKCSISWKYISDTHNGWRLRFYLSFKHFSYKNNMRFSKLRPIGLYYNGPAFTKARNTTHLSLRLRDSPNKLQDSLSALASSRLKVSAPGGFQNWIFPLKASFNLYCRVCLAECYLLFLWYRLRLEDQPEPFLPSIECREYLHQFNRGIG